MFERLLTWPLPAAATWALAWVLALGLRGADAPAWAALALPTALGALAALLPGVAATAWRRIFVAGGFPLSVLAQALQGRSLLGDAGGLGGPGGGMPSWWWLAPLALLLLAYPRRAWRDAPVFPTPRGALDGLPAHIRLADGARVLDAGCGMGDGLIALHAAWPQARVEGVEWSALWRAVSAWRCPWARVHRGDMWADDWSAFDLVYLFQRPETMPRAMAKASAEMRPGCWLVSLEFEAPGWHPHARIDLAGGRPVWVYRLGHRPVHGAAPASASGDAGVKRR